MCAAGSSRTSCRVCARTSRRSSCATCTPRLPRRPPPPERSTRTTHSCRRARRRGQPHSAYCSSRCSRRFSSTRSRVRVHVQSSLLARSRATVDLSDIWQSESMYTLRIILSILLGELTSCIAKLAPYGQCSATRYWKLQTLTLVRPTRTGSVEFVNVISSAHESQILPSWLLWLVILQFYTFLLHLRKNY